MRIAVKSTGGITESFIHVDDVDAGVKEAARQVLEDYAVPADIQLWSDNPDNGPSRKLAKLRFVAVDGHGNVVDLDRTRVAIATRSGCVQPVDTRTRKARWHPRARTAGGVKAGPPKGAALTRRPLTPPRPVARRGAEPSA